MNRSNSICLIGGLMFASVIAGFTPTALADAAGFDGQAKSIIVRYDDLNLEAEAGARTLVNRIATAAMQVCGSRQNERSTLEARRQFETCRASAMQSAITTVDHP